MEQREAISKLKTYFEGRDFPLVYLFGSRAAGRAGPVSDYDIAILARSLVHPRIVYEIAHELSSVLCTDRLDIILLNRSPVELQYRIIKDGIPLYKESELVRVEFEAMTLSRYFDFLPVLRKQREEILEEGRRERGVQRYRAAIGKTLRVLDEIEAFAEKDEGGF